MNNKYKLRKLVKKLNNRKIVYCIASGILALTVIVFAGKTLSKNNNIGEALLIKIDGKDVGYVTSQKKLDNIVDSVEKELEKKYSTEVIISTDNISTKVVSGINEFMDDETLAKELSQSANYYLEGATIKIEGKNILSVKNESVARNVLTGVKKAYLKEGSAYSDVFFEEDTEIVVEDIKAKDILEYEEAVRLLLTGTVDKQEHVVKNGESFWSIAKKYGLKVESLMESNPGIDEGALQIGKTISLAIPVPYLNVISLEKCTVSEKINYQVEYEKTNVLYEGEERIKQEGKYGIKEIEKVITRKNGQETNAEIIAAEVIEEPGKQVVLLGTKEIPESIGTGDLGNPTRGSGTLTSVFGRRWGRDHNGVDIAGDRGCSIYAADGGVVTFSGWKGDYGYLIIIDHGGNRSTYYGHCDKLLVKEGELVEKNQEIAKMGDTGRTTGVHVHFEVRVNNVPQDPSKYIEY